MILTERWNKKHYVHYCCYGEENVRTTQVDEKRKKASYRQKSNHDLF